MTREGLDGINSDAVYLATQKPTIIAYYIDGPYAWSQDEINMFPNSVHIRIATRFTTNDGHFIDCENGDATPSQAAQWCSTRRSQGNAYPGVYTSISNQNAVIDAFNAMHEPLPLWWLAHYDNLDTLPAGAVGKQYASLANEDKSIWADFIPGIDGVDDVPLENDILATPMQNILDNTQQNPVNLTAEFWLKATNNFCGAIYSVVQTQNAAIQQLLTGMTNQATMIQELQTAVTALGTPATELTGNATVNVTLAPKSG